MPSFVGFVTLSILSFQVIIPTSVMGFASDPDVVRSAANNNNASSSGAERPPGGVVVVVDDRTATGRRTRTRTLPPPPPPAPFLVRLHLIRHGETHANACGVVLGQGDSPLTDAGLAVARRASLSDAINGRGGGSTALRYWRAYCSDLDRARTTARIVLGLNDIGRRGMGRGGDDDDDGVDGDDLRLVADPRLREIAKGAREGYLKRYTVEEALVMRRREASASSFDGSASSSCALLSDIDIDIPKLEGEDDAWDRARDWIDSIIDDAFDEYRSRDDERRERRDQVEKGVVVVASSTGDVDDDDDDHPKVYDVFALSHSALIRTMIRRMVGSQLPSDYARTREGSLDVPNLSRTIIDVRPYRADGMPRIASRGNDDNDDDDDDRPSSNRPGWTASLRRLADVSHLHHDSGQEGPPYL
jgi:broad specificity phosphatase PhoE